MTPPIRLICTDLRLMSPVTKHSPFVWHPYLMHGGAMFGEILRAHRMRLVLTQEEVADLSGVSVRHIRDLELGRIARPRRKTIDRLATALRLTATQRRELDRLSR